jgi:hypothetical protein
MEGARKKRLWKQWDRKQQHHEALGQDSPLSSAQGMTHIPPPANPGGSTADAAHLPKVLAAETTSVTDRKERSVVNGDRARRVRQRGFRFRFKASMLSRATRDQNSLAGNLLRDQFGNHAEFRQSA